MHSVHSEQLGIDLITEKQKSEDSLFFHVLGDGDHLWFLQSKLTSAGCESFSFWVLPLSNFKLNPRAI